MNEVHFNNLSGASAGKTVRKRELDILRGIAIILVLFRHSHVAPFLTTMGWIGVDLFFVLSGYLVSGILFSELDRTGKVDVPRFLIRRGFKIYPLYYLSLTLYALYMLSKQSHISSYALADILFIQNYVFGWGYLFPASWSLAVEEHFYLLVSLFFLLASYRIIDRRQNISNFFTFINVERICVSAFILCFFFRLLFNTHNDDPIRAFTMTHLRIDSLSAGVLLCYWMRYRREKVEKILQSKKNLILPVVVCCLIWTPKLEPLTSFFARTYGFTLLCIAFSVILGYTLVLPKINQKIDLLFSRRVADFIAKIGYCSYAIYLIHSLVNFAFDDLKTSLSIEFPGIVTFLITTAISVAIGMLLTLRVERYFLKVRDLRFPGRA